MVKYKQDYAKEGSPLIKWIDGSLALNFVIIPLFLGIIVGITERSKYSDFYNISQQEEHFVLSGTLNYSDLRHRRMTLKSGSKRHGIVCDLNQNRTLCVQGRIALPAMVKIKVFTYRGQNVLLSISQMNGKSIIDERIRIKEILSYSENVKKDSFSGSFLVGAFMGLIFAVIRYGFFMRKRRVVT